MLLFQLGSEKKKGPLGSENDQNKGPLGKEKDKENQFIENKKPETKKNESKMPYANKDEYANLPNNPIKEEKKNSDKTDTKKTEDNQYSEDIKNADDVYNRFIGNKKQEIEQKQETGQKQEDQGEKHIKKPKKHKHQKVYRKTNNTDNETKTETETEIKTEQTEERKDKTPLEKLDAYIGMPGPLEKFDKLNAGKDYLKFLYYYGESKEIGRDGLEPNEEHIRNLVEALDKCTSEEEITKVFGEKIDEMLANKDWESKTNQGWQKQSWQEYYDDKLGRSERLNQLEGVPEYQNYKGETVPAVEGTKEYNAYMKAYEKAGGLYFYQLRGWVNDNSSELFDKNGKFDDAAFRKQAGWWTGFYINDADLKNDERFKMLAKLYGTDKAALDAAKTQGGYSIKTLVDNLKKSDILKDDSPKKVDGEWVSPRKGKYANITEALIWNRVLFNSIFDFSTMDPLNHGAMDQATWMKEIGKPLNDLTTFNFSDARLVGTKGKNNGIMDKNRDGVSKTKDFIYETNDEKRDKRIKEREEEKLKTKKEEETKETEKKTDELKDKTVKKVDEETKKSKTKSDKDQEEITTKETKKNTEEKKETTTEKETKKEEKTTEVNEKDLFANTPAGSMNNNPVPEWFVGFGKSAEMKAEYTALLKTYTKSSVNAIINSATFASGVNELIEFNADPWTAKGDKKALAMEVGRLIAGLESDADKIGTKKTEPKVETKPEKKKEEVPTKITENKEKKVPEEKEQTPVEQTGSSVFTGAYATEISWVNDQAGKEKKIADWVAENLKNSDERDAVLSAFKGWVNSESFPYSAEKQPEKMSQAVNSMLEQLEDLKKKYNSR